MTKWRMSDIEKAQKVLENAGVIPKGLHPNHIKNKLKLLGFTPDTPNETMIIITRKYEKFKEDPECTNRQAAEAAHREYEIEQMDFDKVEEIPIPELPPEVKERLMAKEELYEAPASATVRITSPNGYDWLFTIRDFTANDLFDKVKVIEGIFKNAGYYAEGHGYTAQTSSAPSEDDPAWCSIHNCEMKKYEKDGRTWYSHKVGDSWCKGK